MQAKQITRPRKVILKLGEPTPYLISKSVTIAKLRIVLFSPGPMSGKKVKMKAHGQGPGQTYDFGEITLAAGHPQNVDILIEINKAIAWDVVRIAIEPSQDKNWPIFMRVDSLK